jgi:hypothetical protein
MAKKSNFKRLIRKYEYLSEELIDIQEMHSEATMNFNKALSGSDNADQYLPNGEEEIDDEEKEHIEMSSKYKKLFRKIVLKCHPDKISDSLSDTEKLELRSIYEICTESYDLGEPTPLIVCAVKLDIDVSDFEEDIEEIETACNDIQGMIDEIQGTAAWYYEHILKEDSEKEEFIKKFISLTKGKNLEDL